MWLWLIREGTRVVTAAATRGGKRDAQEHQLQPCLRSAGRHGRGRALARSQALHPAAVGLVAEGKKTLESNYMEIWVILRSQKSCGIWNIAPWWWDSDGISYHSLSDGIIISVSRDT